MAYRAMRFARHENRTSHARPRRAVSKTSRNKRMEEAFGIAYEWDESVAVGYPAARR
jgi:hypothetical protein